MPRIKLTAGDFGEGPAAADLDAFHLPDRLRPGAVLVVPLADVAEMEMLRSDNTNRIKSAIRTGLGGLLSAGPAGLSAGLLAAGRAPQSVFTVRLRDGRAFTALAAAGDFAEIHAAHVEAVSAARAHPADALIARYLDTHNVFPVAAAAVVRDSESGQAAERPVAKASAQARATFGRRRPA